MGYQEFVTKKLNMKSIFIILILLMLVGWVISDINRPTPSSVDIKEIETRDTRELVEFTHDGTKYVYTDDRSRVRYSSLDSFDPPLNFKYINGSTEIGEFITILRWSPSNEYLVVADQESKITIWNVSSNKPSIAQELDNVVTAIDGPFREVAWSVDSQKVAVVLANNTIIIWNVINGNIEKQYQLGNIFHAEIAWSPDGNYLAVTRGEDFVASLLYSINLLTDEYLEYESVIKYEATDVKWNGQNQIIVSSYEGELITWDSETTKIVNYEDFDVPISRFFILDAEKAVVSQWYNTGLSRIISLSKNVVLASFEGMVFHVDQENTSLSLLSKDNVIKRFDYSNVEEDFEDYRFRVVSGQIIMVLAVVTLIVWGIVWFRRY